MRVVALGPRTLELDQLVPALQERDVRLLPSLPVPAPLLVLAGQDSSALGSAPRGAPTEERAGDAGRAVLTGAGPGLFALATYGHSIRQATLDRRRQLYGGAFKAAMGWVEGYYRVRRRQPGDGERLAQHLHDVWEEVAYYEAWLATEAPELGWSYRQLVSQIKQSVSPLIAAAWSQPAQPMAKELSDEERRPDTLPEVIQAREQYLEDVRRHMSLWPWNRWELYRRYRAHTGDGHHKFEDS